MASSRNGSGNYSFYVRIPRDIPEWETYLEENARPFTEADKSGFAARFPEDAAEGNWPKFVFTSGYFNGTWARHYGRNETVILIR